jgi:hypothetical protein
MKLDPYRRETVAIDPGAVANNGVGDDAWRNEQFKKQEQTEEDGSEIAKIGDIHYASIRQGERLPPRGFCRFRHVCHTPPAMVSS